MRTVLGVVLAICVSVASARVPAVAADANAGAELVQKNGCAGCHGAGLAGGAIGPKLRGIERRESFTEIAKALRHPKAPMPSFSFSDAQIADIVAYVSALDGGVNGAPVAFLNPPKPGAQAWLTVRFRGTPPKSVVALPSMKMGGSMMSSAKLRLHPTGDPHVWTGKIRFSMGGPWTIDIEYDGKHLTLPVDVVGRM